MRKLLVAGFVIALVAAGCGDSDTASPSSTSPRRTPAITGTITVSAAASLTEAFTEIGTAFGKADPDASVAFNFGSSTTLATQIQQGAPADGFASADESNMEKLVTAGLVEGTPTVFARNQLVIVTEPGNPERVGDLADLAHLDVVSLCGVEVPCGRYADQVLAEAGIVIPEDRITRGQDVKTTLGALTRSDADAAIAYATDAASAGDAVGTVTIPAAQNVYATYPIAVLSAGGNRATAEAFVRYVTAPKGQAILKSFGFLPAA